jgi:DNA repair protein RecO (recombination protein O)
MRLIDQGIILSIRKYSESSLIVKILSMDHGVYSGFVRGGSGSSKKKFSSKSALYQNFNLVDFEWSSKVEDNLGFFKIELKKSFLGDIISHPIALSSFGAIAAIIEQNVLEREPSKEIFLGLLNLLQNINCSNEFHEEVFLKQYIKFEIELLRTLGYGIDLSECAATGVTDNLHFVSPKSARAVCLEAGEKYRDRLLALPQFLLRNEDLTVIKDVKEVKEAKEELLNGLKLTGFFIDKYLGKQPKLEVFSSRDQLISLVSQNNF